jgi:ACR3 family arsenite efflux pump ArsB
LPGWIIAAIAAGLGLGRLLPELAGDLNTATVGLLLVTSLVLNWLIGPALMFALPGRSCPTCRPTAPG